MVCSSVQQGDYGRQHWGSSSTHGSGSMAGFQTSSTALVPSVEMRPEPLGSPGHPRKGGREDTRKMAKKHPGPDSRRRSDWSPGCPSGRKLVAGGLGISSARGSPQTLFQESTASGLTRLLGPRGNPGTGCPALPLASHHACRDCALCVSLGSH